MIAIDLNCDMGEGSAHDASIMPWITSANIACGAHAGNRDTMKSTVACALEHGVQIGAHPGYADRANFGRIEKQMSDTAIKELLKQQYFELQEIAQKLGARVQHIKPHGALYNQSAKDEKLAIIIAETVASL
ncbi:MAG TPA: LamB/YcsF family protein, partial [Sediminibacterium sp.]|nr:LamB/YcsF family protein [Sediminibacterium sp.]